jgi:uncharacterized cofD-like protein
VKVVGLGGGHGLAATLRAARLYADEVAAVVTVADDGGSSGRLTREYGIPPPGDIRNCLVALADPSRLADIYQHRFDEGPFIGHTVGNIVIAALSEMTGDFATAVATAGDLIAAKGRVFPATTELVRLGARVEGGEIDGQVAVAQTHSPIEAVYLTPADPPAHEGAVAAIGTADQVVMGPGSLFTSLLAALLVPGIADALRSTSARRVFVCNSRMQKGETETLDATGHVTALIGHVGADSVDVVVVQSPELPTDGVRLDRSSMGMLDIEIVEADVARPDGSHDPRRLAEVLGRLHK